MDKPRGPLSAAEIAELEAQCVTGINNEMMSRIWATLRAALKERDEAQEKECICPACGTEWTSGAPQRCRTTLIAERDAALARIKDYEHALMRLHDETVGQREHLEHLGCTEGEWRDCYYGNDGDDSLKEYDLCNYHDAIVGARALLSRLAQAEGEKNG